MSRFRSGPVLYKNSRNLFSLEVLLCGKENKMERYLEETEVHFKNSIKYYTYLYFG